MRKLFQAVKFLYSSVYFLGFNLGIRYFYVYLRVHLDKNLINNWIWRLKNDNSAYSASCQDFAEILEKYRHK